MHAAPNDHPPDHVLDAFGLGKLDERAAEAVGRHLQTCASCCRRLDELPADTFLDYFRGARPHFDSPTCTAPPPAGTPSIDDGLESCSSASVGILSRVRQYHVLRSLGDGGQGSAYLARDAGLGRLVVLKRYHARSGDIEQEGQSLARVRSRYTAQCYALERQGDEVFLVMEYIPGDSLSDVCKKRALSSDQAVRLVEQVAEGLEAMHACGLVHRDIKPSNIVMGDDGVPRLVDFGLAAHLGSEALRAISGSPPYMAPEQARGQWERIDARTDVYGLGAVLYHLLTGQPPRDGKTPIEVLEQARDHPVVPLRQRNPKVPRVLERICLKAMAADPQSRFPSAAALRGALRGYRLRRWAAPAVGAAVVLLALFVTARAFGPGPAQPAAGGPAGAIASPGSSGPRSELEPAAPSHLRVTRFEIRHFPKLDAERFDPRRLGTLGRNSFTTRVDDEVTVRAELSEPAYAYLIAFRPDGTDELCDPDDEETRPPRKPEPMYPPPSKSTDRILLSEGAGLHAFAVVVSREPLPSYREWKRLHGRIPWDARIPCEPGVVWLDDDQGLQPLAAAGTSDNRGKGSKARGSGEPAARLAIWLRGRAGVDVVAVEAFPVLPAAGE
jgi:predicted Ser/Thr protein kinase